LPRRRSRPLEPDDDGEPRYELGSGLHRLQAALLNGATHINAIVMIGGPRKARLWQFEENLVRVEPTVLEHSIDVARWIKAKEKEKPVLGQLDRQPRGGRPKGGVALAARMLPVAGKSDEARRKSVDRALKIAGVSADAQDAAKAAGLDDNQSALLQIAGAPTPQADQLAEQVNSISAWVEQARELGVAETSLEGLSEICAESQRSADALARIVQLISQLLAIAGRDAAAPIDFKAEAMAAGYLHQLRQLPPDNLRFRSSLLADESAIDTLTAAQAIANEAHAAAAEAKFEETPNVAFSESIPSIQELRQAAGARDALCATDLNRILSVVVISVRPRAIDPNQDLWPLRLGTDGPQGSAASVSSATTSPQGDMISVQPMFSSPSRTTAAGQANA
jgi:ParB-like chromosome segregation protein Spo0J